MCIPTSQETRRYRGKIDLLTAMIIIGVVGIALFILSGGGVGGSTAGNSAVNWRTDFDAAVVESVSSGKPLLVDFTATWCPPCKTMKKEVWSNDEVAQASNTRFIPVLIDVDQQPSLAQQFKVSSIPTIKVISDGKEIYSSNFHDKNAMMRVLNQYGAN